MHAVNAQIKRGFFSFLFNDILQFLFSLFDNFLNAPGVDPPVGDQAFQGDLRGLPAIHVKARNGHRFGGVIDNDINARRGLQRADIAAFPSDDAAFHFIAGQRHDGDR